MKRMLQDCLTLFSVQSQGMTTEYHQREIPYRDKEQCHCYTFFHTLGVQFKMLFSERCWYMNAELLFKQPY